MTVDFEIEGQPFIALNGGPHYKLNPAISFLVDCKTQEEVDHLWWTLSHGGQTLECGWVPDRFGVILTELINDKDARKSGRVVKATMQMIKIDIEALKRPYADK